MLRPLFLLPREVLAFLSQEVQVLHPSTLLHLAGVLVFLSLEVQVQHPSTLLHPAGVLVFLSMEGQVLHPSTLLRILLRFYASFWRSTSDY